MIYFVTNNLELFTPVSYKLMSVEDSLAAMSSWRVIQFDVETAGKDPHLCKLLCAQFGNDKADMRIVVDCSTVDIRLYKSILESKMIIGHNLKFDLQFLYNYEIIPLKVYDTMIVEQLLYLGYPPGTISYSLKEIALRRLGINIDKTVRGEIIWRGLDTKVILYAAGDVTYLEQIMRNQVAECKAKQCLKGAEIECNFVPAIAYLEWCGIKLDTEKWKQKMQQDKRNLEDSIKALNDYCINKPQLKKWVYVDTQGDLFNGFDLTPKFKIDWQKKESIHVFKALGFNVNSVSKLTGEDSESKTEKLITSQKGIDDEFLRLYYGKGEPEDDDYYPGYNGSYKVVTSFGQGHLNAINPKTGRIHTVYRAIGTVSGRMSSGSQQPNTDLAKVKGLKPKDCTYPNLQQLPSNAITRGCFIPENGNLFCSCDYSAKLNYSH